MDLKVMTFNIRNGLAEDGQNSWMNRRSLTAQVIRESACDLIGLQEVFDFQLDYLMGELLEFECYSVGREDGLSGGEHCTIIWRRGMLTRLDAGTFWLSSAPDMPNSVSWGNRITRICSWVQFAEGMTFFNTHWDHESERARFSGAELIASRLPRTPWILVGDLNAEPDWREVTPLAKHPNSQCITRGNSTATFHDFCGGTIGDHIDHIFSSTDFVSSDMKVLVSPRASVYPSDHYPVIVNLTLPINPVE